MNRRNVMNKTRTLTYVWPKSIRLFHWINVITISLLIVIGLIIFNGKTLGVTVDAKIMLKTIHVTIGYIFAINLIIRLVMGFIGSSNDMWSQTLPVVPTKMSTPAFSWSDWFLTLTPP